jgi:hypothetical protein
MINNIFQSSHNKILSMFYFCFKYLIKTIPCIHFLHKSQKKSNLNQIIKCIRKSQQDIQFKSKHQLYP